MRLTLRTLLAYLDDRLPPNNAKEIGQKIANSPFATELVERIRDVKRRRRLASPGKPQPMIDANLVAEYLDDQLTPELVARVEREILASDAMLAEVASAHEVLGMLRDPVAIEPRLRDRLYLLDPTGQTDVVRAAGGEISAPAPNAVGTTPQWKPLKSHSTSGRRWPIVVGVLLGLIWIAVVATDSRLFSPAANDSGSDANADVKLAANDGEKPANEPEDSAPDDMPKKPEANAPQQNDMNVAEAQKDTAPEVAADAEKAKAPDATVAAAEAEKPTSEPAANANLAKTDDAGKEKVMPFEAAEPAVAAADPPADAPMDRPEVPVVDPAIDDRPASYYVQTESAATLVFDEKANRWMTLASIAGGDAVTMAANQVDCRRLTGRNWIGIPEPFHSVVRTDVGGWIATIPGPSHIRLRGGPDSGFDVLSGRLRVAADPASVWNEEKKSVFQLGVGEVTARVVLQSKDSRVAIEVIPVAATMPAEMDEQKSQLAKVLPVDAEFQARLTVVEGGTAVTLPARGEQPPVEQMLNRGQRMLWTVLSDSTVSSVTIDNGEPLASAPRWLFETEIQDVPEQAAIRTKLIEAMKTNPDPDECIHPLFSDRNPQVGVLAVRIASITRDVERLMSVVYAEHDEVIHRAAIDGLSAILQSSTTGRDLIRRAVETRLPMPLVEPTMKLIAGLTPAQAADPNVVADLMKMLEDNSLATRTLAIYRMEQYTKDRMNYFPDNEPSRRREAIRRWQRFLDRNGGKLIP